MSLLALGCGGLLNFDFLLAFSSLLVFNFRFSIIGWDLARFKKASRSFSSAGSIVYLL